MSSFSEKFASLKDRHIVNLRQSGECIWITLSDETVIEATYWRINGSETRLSSFDHGLKYGLPTPINAVEELKRLLKAKTIIKSMAVAETGDLVIYFEESLWLEIFNFTGNEVWEVTFSDGSGQLSNYE